MPAGLVVSETLRTFLSPSSNLLHFLGVMGHTQERASARQRQAWCPCADESDRGVTKKIPKRRVPLLIRFDTILISSRSRRSLPTAPDTKLVRVVTR